jgi:hypothetical protein
VYKPRPIGHGNARVLLQINAVASEHTKELIFVASGPLLRNLLEANALSLSDDLLNLLTSLHFLKKKNIFSRYEKLCVEMGQYGNNYSQLGYFLKFYHHHHKKKLQNKVHYRKLKGFFQKRSAVKVLSLPMS